MLLRILIITICCFVTAQAIADTIHYDNLESPGMYFTDLSETSGFDDLPLYGAPAVVGNGIEFLNSSFEASTAGSQLDFVDGRFDVTVTSKEGASLTGITLYETGTFINSGINMEAAVSAVAFAVADGKIYESTFSIISQSPTNDKWERALSIQFDHPVSSFSFVADNQLFALSGAESTAFVSKDYVSLSVNIVPEPSSGLALISIVFGIVHCRRRRD